MRQDAREECGGTLYKRAQGRATRVATDIICSSSIDEVDHSCLSSHASEGKIIHVSCRDVILMLETYKNPLAHLDIVVFLSSVYASIVS